MADAKVILTLSISTSIDTAKENDLMKLVGSGKLSPQLFELINPVVPIGPDFTVRANVYFGLKPTDVSGKPVETFEHKLIDREQENPKPTGVLTQNSGSGTPVVTAPPVVTPEPVKPEPAVVVTPPVVTPEPVKTEPAK